MPEECAGCCSSLFYLTMEEVITMFYMVKVGHNQLAKRKWIILRVH